jgi:serine-type anaerobic sulfatase-maturating enzyme
VQQVRQLVWIADEVVVLASYKAFFHHADRPMRLMGGLLARHRSPAQIMQLYASEDARRDRYGPGTCGSGRKWKFCHGAGR